MNENEDGIVPGMPAGLPADQNSTFDSKLGPRPGEDVLDFSGVETRSPSIWMSALSATPAHGVPGPEEVPYTLRRMIGRGGFGEVWEAVQTSLNRSIAIKQLHVERVDTVALLERERLFRHEALTTAALDHPNIVPVYDFGQDQGGRPMLAMKLVRGEPWHAAIARDFVSMGAEDFLGRHLPILADVAQAVEFAHDGGIVHRDLKPSQVMLGSYGEVLLMDWGLAVLVDAEGAATGVSLAREKIAPSPSEASNPAGTPAFMAPEQTLADASLIGKWTDVYLLGACLYVLLTGHCPHQAENSKKAFLHAKEGIVEDPCTRTPGRHMPEDLVELAMEALGKDPKKRTKSAREFLDRIKQHLSGSAKRQESKALVADVGTRIDPLPDDYGRITDLLNELDRARLLWPGNTDAVAMRERLLAQQSVIALEQGDLRLAGVTIDRLQPSKGRDVLRTRVTAAEKARAQRERERRRLRLATAGLLTIVFVGGAWFTMEVSQQRDAAEDARGRAEVSQKKAEESRKRAEDLLGFMIGDLRNKLEAVGRLDVLDDVGTRAGEYFASLPMDPGDHVAARQKLTSQYQLALIEGARGKTEEAVKSFTKLIPGIIAGAQSHPSDPAWQDLAGDILFEKSARLRDDGRTSETLKLLDEAQAFYDKLLKLEPGSEDFQAQPWLVEHSRARTLESIDADQSFAIYERILARAREGVSANPKSRAWRGRLGVGLTDVASVLQTRGNLEEAYKLLVEALTVREGMLKDDPNDTFLRREYAIVLSTTAENLAQRDMHDESLEYNERAAEVLEALAAADPTNASRQNEYAVAISHVGGYYESKEMYAEALTRFEECLRVTLYLSGIDPSNREAKQDVAVVSSRLGFIIMKDGKPLEARPHYVRAEQIMKELSEAEPDNLTWQMNYAVMCQRTAQLQVELDNPTEAEASFRSGLSILKALCAKQPDDVVVRDFAYDAYRGLGNLLVKVKRPEDAIIEYRAAKEIVKGLIDKSSFKWRRRIISLTSDLTTTLMKLGRPAEALPEAEEGQAMASEVFLERQSSAVFRLDLAFSMRRLASVHLKLDNPGAAAKVVQQTAETMGVDTGAPPPEMEGRMAHAWVLAWRGRLAVEAGDKEIGEKDLARVCELVAEEVLAGTPDPMEPCVMAKWFLGQREEARSMAAAIKKAKSGSLATDLIELPGFDIE